MAALSSRKGPRLARRAGGQRKLSALSGPRGPPAKSTEAADGATTSARAWLASMTTLVTGFDAFGGVAVNSSELVVTALAARAEPGVITAVLPTSYRRAGARI